MPAEPPEAPEVARSEPARFEPPPAFYEFRVLRPLGRGATGEVFLAEDELLGRQVAIKFARHADRPEMRARFLLEARALARLQHPNVVTVHRVGEVLGRPFLVAEWVQGRSLDLVPLPLPEGTLLQVALQLARALAAVHRMGVLHRDIKPGNVLLADSGELKLVDFGVSLDLDAADAPELPSPPLALAATQPLPGAPQPGGRGPAALQVGTPLYAAPELLAGAPGSRQSDLYGWGAVVYEVCTGRPPYQAQSIDELRLRAEQGDFAPLRDAPEPLAALVHRCLLPRPQDRPQRAEELLDLLEPALLARGGGALPAEPFRGLSVFGPEHAALFFGREREVRAVLDRLRDGSLVLVAGDSGVGKTSLCRAGVLPQVTLGGLERGRRYQVAEAVLAGRSLEALAAALAPWLGLDERSTAAALRWAPEEVAVRVRAVPPGEGRALFLDGLEELVSGASTEDGELLGRFIGSVAVRTAGFRCLATARSDYLTRLSALPALGSAVGSALYLLRPLTDEALRQAIEAPARAAGFRFSPESLVDELVAAAKLGPGALPLVQFALVEMWSQRNLETRVISGEALAAIGGVGGALARHADEVVAGLPAPQRRAAEQILRRLVTAQGARARRAREELPDGTEVDRALESLTAARLLIARDPAEGQGGTTWELAHDALLQGWDQLRAWLGQDAQKRALAQRVERAAEEWERLGAASEGLWSRRQLREVAWVRDLAIGGRERRFLAASRAGAQRRRALQIGAAVAVPCVLLAIGFVARDRAQLASREQARAYQEAAQAALSQARSLDTEEAALRPQMFARFDAGQTAQAEQDWAQVRRLRERIEEQLAAARGALDAAQLFAPGGEDARQLLAALLVFRLEREAQSPLSRAREGLLAQLAPLDPHGTLRARFQAPARVRLDALDAGVQAVLRSLGPGPSPLPLSPGAERVVRPGAYVLELSTGARLPLLLHHGEAQALRIPRAAPVPPGFIHVLAGSFLTGFDGDEDVRLGFFNASPLHERSAPGFAISRAEATFAQWLEYLRSLPAAARAVRMPRGGVHGAGLSLSTRPDGKFVLRLKPTTQTYVVTEGELLTYPGRRRNATVDWLRFPVSGVSFDDAQAFAAWLDRTARVPGARLCTEVEWERAARGADGRSFPSGDSLAGDEANIDETYGREPLAFGPDPVGAHPASSSPVGAVDLAGNAWELTTSREGTPVIRGGSWYQGALTARSVNREPYEATARDALIGFRLCTDAP